MKTRILLVGILIILAILMVTPVMAHGCQNCPTGTYKCGGSCYDPICCIKGDKGDTGDIGPMGPPGPQADVYVNVPVDVDQSQNQEQHQFQMQIQYMLNVIKLAQQNYQSMVINNPVSPTVATLGTSDVIKPTIVSIYPGEVLVVCQDDETYMQEDEVAIINVSSAQALLVYPFEDVDKEKVLHDVNMKPAYDPIRQVFEHGGLYVPYYNNDLRSTYQQISFKAKEVAKYCFALDGRVSIEQDSVMSKIGKGSVDITFDTNIPMHIYRTGMNDKVVTTPGPRATGTAAQSMAAMAETERVMGFSP